MFSKILNKCSENIKKYLKNICERGHFSLSYKLKTPGTELIFSKVTGWRPATLLKVKFLHRYVLQTLMTFPDTFCGFLQVSGTPLMLNTSKWPHLQAVGLYLLTDILHCEEVLSKVILEFT